GTRYRRRSDHVRWPECESRSRRCGPRCVSRSFRCGPRPHAEVAAAFAARGLGSRGAMSAVARKVSVALFAITTFDLALASARSVPAALGPPSVIKPAWRQYAGSAARFRGITESPNTIASYGPVALPLFLWLATVGKRRIWWRLATVGLVVEVLLSGTRTALG